VRCPGESLHEPDGIHLGPAGYRCWKAALRLGLNALDVSGVHAEASPLLPDASPGDARQP
jgi:hypothetical protein